MLSGCETVDAFHQRRAQTYRRGEQGVRLTAHDLRLFDIFGAIVGKESFRNLNL